MTHFADFPTATAASPTWAAFEAATTTCPAAQPDNNSAAVLRRPGVKTDWCAPASSHRRQRPTTLHGSGRTGAWPPRRCAETHRHCSNWRPGDPWAGPPARHRPAPMRVGTSWRRQLCRRLPDCVPPARRCWSTACAAPVGRVSMDMLAVDLTPVPPAALGSEVTLAGANPTAAAWPSTRWRRPPAPSAETDVRRGAAGAGQRGVIDEQAAHLHRHPRPRATASPRRRAHSTTPTMDGSVGRQPSSAADTASASTGGQHAGERNLARPLALGQRSTSGTRPSEPKAARSTATPTTPPGGPSSQANSPEPVQAHRTRALRTRPAWAPGPDRARTRLEASAHCRCRHRHRQQAETQPQRGPGLASAASTSGQKISATPLRPPRPGDEAPRDPGLPKEPGASQRVTEHHQRDSTATAGGCGARPHDAPVVHPGTARHR